MNFIGYIYLLIGIVDIVIVFLGDGHLKYFTRPLLMPLLIAFYVRGSASLTRRDWLVILGLVFSWFGDLALMSAAGDKILFLLGLVSFLIAHILYINAYVRVHDRSAPMILRQKPWILIPLLVYLLCLISMIVPTLPMDMKIPVAIYSLVIGTMVAFALNRYKRVSDGSFALVFGGALLFMFSDSTIAVNTFLFHGNFPMAGVFIMSAYIGGQYLIAKGMLKNEIAD